MLGAIVVYFILQQWPWLKALILQINERIWGKVFGLSLLLMYFSPFDLAHGCFAIASIGFAARLILQGVPATNHAVQPHWQQALHYLVLVGLIVLSCSLAYKSTLPITLTNDYIELNDKIIVPDTNPPVALSRDDAVHCLINQAYDADHALLEDTTRKKADASGDDGSSGSPKKINKIEHSLVRGAKRSSEQTDAPNLSCPYQLSQQQADLMNPVLLQSGKWQSQAGRLLYHHSYMYVPIAHMLKYGALSAVPSLYGFGNTLFYAKLMGDKSVTLTSYFSTYPIAQLIGILVMQTLLSLTIDHIKMLERCIEH